MRRPSADELLLASIILEAYEATEEAGADASAARRVAAWLKHQAQNAEFAAARKEAGVRVSVARRALRNRAAVERSNRREGA